jgi:hypothetical protein
VKASTEIEIQNFLKQRADVSFIQLSLIQLRYNRAEALPGPGKVFRHHPTLTFGKPRNRAPRLGR